MVTTQTVPHQQPTSAQLSRPHQVIPQVLTAGLVAQQRTLPTQFALSNAQGVTVATSLPAMAQSVGSAPVTQVRSYMVGPHTFYLSSFSVPVFICLPCFTLPRIYFLLHHPLQAGAPRIHFRFILQQQLLRFDGREV